jgi:hypothetical protein
MHGTPALARMMLKLPRKRPIEQDVWGAIKSLPTNMEMGFY